MKTVALPIISSKVTPREIVRHYVLPNGRAWHRLWNYGVKEIEPESNHDEDPREVQANLRENLGETSEAHRCLVL